jgi:hypothetical protein
MKALEMALSLSETDGDKAEVGDQTLQQKQADALVALARGYLSGDEGRRNCTADHYQVVVHVDEKALRGEPDENSKSDLPIETVRRLCCDGAVLPVTEDDSGPVTEDDSGNPLSVGRKHRVVQPALKRALLARDRCCRYPGCTHEKWLDAHHVMHWADGGDTSLENTLLLCSRHHRLLHEGAFEIKSGADGGWMFRRG